MLEALPTAEVLGSGWSREISLLFDSAGKPAELFGAASRLPESSKKERRDAINNPTNRISGWSHTHFTLQATNASRHFDVQIERYRSQDHLQADFNQLLAFDSADYQKLPIDGVGEAAVLYRSTKSGATVWFRRAHFKVWISPMGPVTNWEQDVHLQHLTRMLDQRIVEGTAAATGSPPPGKGRDKP